MRTTVVSTSKLKTYKFTAITIVSAITVAVLIFGVVSVLKFSEYYQLFIVPLYIMIAYRALPAIIKIKSISYDESSIYYDKKGYEVQIPFEDIKDIEIKTISGIYKLNLYNPTQDGTSIMFKTSLWYPLNFKSQDEKVNVLRDKIDNHKRRLGSHYSEPLPERRIV